MSSPVTIQLFAMDYQLLMLPPEIAATLGTAAELPGAVLTRIGAPILWAWSQ